MNAPPAPRRRALSPSSAAGLLDALRFPLRGAALAALAAVLGTRLLASALPGPIDVLCQAVLWLALYKYALEAMAAAAQGRDAPPEVLAHLDDSIHRRHLWVQVAVLALLTVVLIGYPQYGWLAAPVAALILPGLILALTVAQNLVGAVNPLNWLVVAGKLGVDYALLALAWLGLLLFQFDGRALLDGLGLGRGLLAGALFYLISHTALLALFRLMGVALFAHAQRLGYEIRVDTRPVLQRDREQHAVTRGIAEAREAADPAERAERLREAVRLGAAEPVQREYRAALRAAGRLDALDAHARVRASELVALGDFRAALTLVQEALQDNPSFTLPEAEPLNMLLDRMERAAQWRSASALACNYRAAYPKRQDGIALAMRAAGILADRLHDRDAAAALLDEAIAQTAPADDDAPLRLMRARLANGLPLTPPTAAAGPTPGQP